MRAWWALLRKDWRVLCNLRRLARRQSRFKLLFVGGFGAALMAGLGWLFLDGLRFLDALGGVGVMLVQHLFGLFFFGLGLMLVLSNLITAYTTVYHSRELPFLWPRPMPHGVLLLHLWVETTLLSSWAFICVLLPFLGAFAWHERLSPWFLLWTLLFAVPFALLHAGAGLLLALVLFRWLPRWRSWGWVLALAAAGAAAWGFGLLRTYKVQNDDAAFVLAHLVPGLRLAAYPLWPSRWVADGVMALARGQALRGWLLFATLLAQVLLLGAVLEGVGRRLLFRAWLRVRAAVPRARRAARPAPACACLAALAPDTRAMLLKDWRTFRRDPAQWIQGLLFFGLLGLYVFNLRTLNYHLLSAVWRNLIVFLNLFSLSAVMCSFCARFVYPQLSLEGQAFWLIGLAPTSFRRVLRAKFLSALGAMLVLSLGLMALSAALLKVGPRLWAVALALAAALACGLCGLSTGLGAIFLDVRQRNPMAIISGFGGTLNLALGLLFMGAAILPFAAVNHAFLTGRIGPALLDAGSAAAGVWLAALTAAATGIPLALGRRSLAERDY